MEITRIAARRYEYLRKIRKLWAEGFLPVFIDETWYDTHDVVKKAWSDNSGRCNVSKFISKGKRIAICHAGSEFGFIPNSLLMCGKSLSKASADYHQDMNSDVLRVGLKNSFFQIYLRNAYL